MSFRDFVNKSEKRIAEGGPMALPGVTVDFIVSALAKVPIVPAYGKNIYSEDWDVLLILDACRWDMYRDLIGEGHPVWSVGSSSDEWMDHTFTEEYADAISRTAYVTGNPFSENLDAADFAALDEVWKNHWDSNEGTIMPRPITDRVLSHHRSGTDRVIGHYMQPHHPFIASENTGDRMGWNDMEVGEDVEYSLWDQFMYGLRDDIDEIWDAYQENLRFIYEEVNLLLENIDGKVVITADHGNAVGEFGIWGHKPGFLHPKMRYVPWDVRHAQDEETYVPEVIDSEQVERSREDQLRDLGYL